MWKSSHRRLLLAVRLLCHQGCERDTCTVSAEGKSRGCLGTSDPERRIRGKWGPSLGSEQSSHRSVPTALGSSTGKTSPLCWLRGLTGASTWGAEIPLVGRLPLRQSREGRKGGFKPHGWLTGFPQPPHSHPSLSRVILQQCRPRVSAPRWSQEGCRQ